MRDTAKFFTPACAGAPAWRQRAFAWGLAHLTRKYERFIAERKRRLFADLSGTVLEIGAGKGANLRHLPKDRVRWIGIEPNPFMKRYLQQEAERLGAAVEVRDGTADGLDVPEAGVDA